METNPEQQAQVQQANEAEKVAFIQPTLAQLAARALNSTAVVRDGNHEEEKAKVCLLLLVRVFDK
jgi:hypothetical protein